MMGPATFIEQLRALGYEPHLLQIPDVVAFPYEIEVGPLAGETITLALKIPPDFGLTPPSGPLVSPHLMPITNGAGGGGGGWTERAARTELGNILARVRAGIWEPEAPPQRPAAAPGVPTFHEYASAWLKGKIDGVLGEAPIDDNTASDYRWRLSRHRLPFFASRRMDEIDRELCLEFKAHKLQEASELRTALAAGPDLRDRRGRRVQPLGPSSIRKLIDTLGSILEEAVEDGLLERNPGRGKRMKVRVPKPRRSFLEMDELAALLDAAEDQDRLPALPVPTESGDRTRDRVATLAAAGRRPGDIAHELGLSKSTLTFHLRRLGIANREPYSGRRAIVEMLARTGVRVSELCDLRITDVRLHDPGRRAGPDHRRKD
jgi:integrase